MDQVMKKSRGCEEDLCDTCSGDTDDACSVCSWTTDQGDFDVERAASVSDNVRKSINGLPHGIGQDGSMNGAPVFPPMCIGYMPVPMQMQLCYLVMPTMENGLAWQDSNAGTYALPPQHDSHWGQSSHASSTGYTWTKPDPPTKPQRQRSAKTTKSTTTVAPAPKQVSDSSEATTVILRNLPAECSRDTLLQILDHEGFSGKYDFLHVPIDFQTKTGLGYALLNLVTHSAALCVQKHFEGFRQWPFKSDNVCEVAWNSPHQGLATHIERYRNSPLMHSSVPEAYRPVLFVNGDSVDFPAPTTRLRAPRIRHQKPAGTSIKA